MSFVFLNKKHFLRLYLVTSLLGQACFCFVMNSSVHNGAKLRLSSSGSGHYFEAWVAKHRNNVTTNMLLRCRLPICDLLVQPQLTPSNQSIGIDVDIT